MKASVKHIRISPKKANLIAGMVRGKKAKDAADLLKIMNKKAADIIRKVVLSAVANAKNNEGKNEDLLTIGEILVTKGRTYRRGIPASRGRVAPIKKRTSHVFLKLAELRGTPPSAKSKTEKVKEKAVEEKVEKKATVKKTTAKKAPAKKTTTSEAKS